MKSLTKTDYNALKYQKHIFFSALHHNYMRVPPRKDLDVVYNIFDKMTENKHNRNYACSNCILTLYKQVASQFFIAEEKYEKTKK